MARTMPQSGIEVYIALDGHAPTYAQGFGRQVARHDDLVLCVCNKAYEYRADEEITSRSEFLAVTGVRSKIGVIYPHLT